MPWIAILQDGEVRANGSVELSIRYEQTNADGSKGQEFQEPMTFGPNETVTESIVKTRALERVALLNGREAVVNGIRLRKGTNVNTWV